MIFYVYAVYGLLGLVVFAKFLYPKLSHRLEEDHRIEEAKHSSKWRIWVFGPPIVILLVLLWPIIIIAIIADRLKIKREPLEDELLADLEDEAYDAKGIRYSNMGGMGDISCRDCGFSEGIISFTHGYTEGHECCNTGLQCLDCGKFTDVFDSGNLPKKPTPSCDCGGKLSRDHCLFCPRCRSTNLVYRMGIIF